MSRPRDPISKMWQTVVFAGAMLAVPALATAEQAPPKDTGAGTASGTGTGSGTGSGTASGTGAGTADAPKKTPTKVTKKKKKKKKRPRGGGEGSVGRGFVLS
jgi:hypothetical protein